MAAGKFKRSFVIKVEKFRRRFPLLGHSNLRTTMIYTLYGTNQNDQASPFISFYFRLI